MAFVTLFACFFIVHFQVTKQGSEVVFKKLHLIVSELRIFATYFAMPFAKSFAIPKVVANTEYEYLYIINRL